MNLDPNEKKGGMPPRAKAQFVASNRAGPSTGALPLDFNDTAIAFRSRATLELRKAELLFRAMASPTLTAFGPKLVTASLTLRLPVTPLIKVTLFNQFCGGETIEECAATIARLAAGHVGAILDYSVEGKEKEADFDQTLAEILRMIRNAEGDARVPFAVFKVTGIGRFGLLAKVSASAALSPEEKAEFARVKARVEAVAKEAARCGVRLLIDAEESWIQKTVDDLAFALMARYNDGRALVFNTVQLYLRDRYAYLEDVTTRLSGLGRIAGVKLVRGAYMEKERDYAAKAGRPSPIQPDKAATDCDFDRALDFTIANLSRVHVVAGSHNEASNRHLVKLMAAHAIAPADQRVHFAQLYGMSDNLTYNLAFHGYNVAKYVPYGPVRAALPYLFRRAAENTSIQGQTSRELDLIGRELKRRRAEKA